jgi:glycosyltransferase involved in cell wall biosynthesis
MNVLWFSWKDSSHPHAGGAEVVSGQLMAHLVSDGHNVRLITAAYDNSMAREDVGGVTIYRTGGRFTVYTKALWLFRRQMKDWPDLIIDEMNTVPFTAGFYSKKKSALLTYQLTREVWFYQSIFPFSIIGYLIEPIYLYALSRKYKLVITESESTREDLEKYHFNKSKVSVMRIGMALQPTTRISHKQHTNRILFLGAMRPMKRALDAVKAFEIAKDLNPELTLTLAGDSNSKYGRKVLAYMKSSRHTESMEALGRINASDKKKLMQEASLLLVTSVKEGWGLIVTEANSQGTPAIAYDADGLRDSVRDGITGKLVPSSDYDAMGQAIIDTLKNQDAYETMRREAWVWSKEFTFENSYADFINLVKLQRNK